MAVCRAEMWKAYRFQNLDVRVIQQWHDPFGRSMVRIETIDETDSRAEGMLEDVFLAQAFEISGLS